MSYSLQLRRKREKQFKAERFCCNSSKAIEWIEWESHVQGVHFTHAMNGNEMKLGGLSLPVDGYAKLADGTEKVLQFLGCYYHSNRCKANPSGRYKNSVKDEKNNNDTFVKLAYLKWLGYDVQYVWECEFDRQKTKNCK